MAGIGRARLSGALAGIAAAVLGAVGGAVPSSAATAPVQTLAGLNVVHTSASGVATVRLAQPAQLEQGGFRPAGPGASGVYGHGRILAMVLEQNGVPLVRYFRISDCVARGCTGRSFELVIAFGPSTLQPGLYHLYIAADGAPATGVLALKGLSGTSEIGVAPTSGITVTSLVTQLPSTGTGEDMAYSAADSTQVGPFGGLELSDTPLTVDHYLAGWFGACIGEGSTSSAYVASCSSPADPFFLDDVANPYLICDPRWVVFAPAAITDPTGLCQPQWLTDAATSGFPPFVMWAGADIRPGHAASYVLGAYAQGAMTFKSALSAGLWISFLPPEQPAKVARTIVPSPAASPSATSTATPGGGTPAVRLPNTSAGGPGATGAALACGVGAVITLAGRRRRRGGGKPGA